MAPKKAFQKASAPSVQEHSAPNAAKEATTRKRNAAPTSDEEEKTVLATKPPKTVHKVTTVATFKHKAIKLSRMDMMEIRGPPPKLQQPIITSLVVDPLTNTLFSSNHTGEIEAFDMNTASQEAKFTCKDTDVDMIIGWIHCMVITPDGCNVISGDSAIRVWHLKEDNDDDEDDEDDDDDDDEDDDDGDKVKRCHQTLDEHSDEVHSLAINRSGTLVASGSADTSIMLWECTTDDGFTLEHQQTLDGDPDVETEFGPNAVMALVMVNDGKQLVSGAMDSIVKVWELQPEPKVLHSLVGHSGPIRALAVTPDEKHVVSASQDKTLRVWELSTGRCIAILSGHSSGVGCVCVTSDGGTVVSGSGDGTLRCWDLTKILSDDVGTNKIQTVEAASVVVQVGQGKEGVLSMTLLAGDDGDRLFSGGCENTIKMWRLESK